MKELESRLWKYLHEVTKNTSLYMTRVEVRHPAGISDVLYSIARERQCEKVKNFKKSIDTIHVIEDPLEKRKSEESTSGWIELKLVKLEEVSYNGKYDYGLRKEQALWLNSWWRLGGLSWTLIGITSKGKWNRFVLTSGKYAYRILREISLEDLEQVSTVFADSIDANTLTKSLLYSN